MSREDAEGLLLMEEEGHSDLISFQPTDSDIPSFLEDCNRVQWQFLSAALLEWAPAESGERREGGGVADIVAGPKAKGCISALARPSCPGASTRCGLTCRTSTTCLCWCPSSLTVPLRVSPAPFCELGGGPPLGSQGRMWVSLAGSGETWAGIGWAV